MSLSHSDDASERDVEEEEEEEAEESGSESDEEGELTGGEKRELARDYRHLDEQLRQFEADDVCRGADVLLQQLKITNNLYDRGGQKTFPILDAHCLKATSVATDQLVHNLRADSHQFELSRFADRLLARLSPSLQLADDGDRVKVRSEDWVKFGAQHGHIQRLTPSFHFLFGSVEPQPIEKKERSKRQRIVKKPETEAVRPENVDPKENQHDLEVEYLARKIKKLHKLNKKPMPFFPVVVDPDSFSHTVENIFHASFLAKDGHLKMEKEEEVVIEPDLTQGNRRSSRNVAEDANHHQTCLSFSMQDWQKWVAKYQIEKAAIKKKQN